MNIFTKAKLVKILNDKVQRGEIHNFNLTESYLRITKSKRTGFTFRLNELSDGVLLSLLKKTIPNPSVQNINSFYNKEIKKYNHGI